MIEILIFSFFAGVLTVLAPCILPLIPVVIGGSLSTQTARGSVDQKRPFIIIASLITSILLFSLLLKASTALLGIPTTVWSVISGVIIILLGINALIPTIWETIMLKTKLSFAANTALGNSQRGNGISRDIALGAALGPVFNSCSPTYALIIAVLLPASFASGVVYLFAYCLGLGLVLLLFALFGQSLVTKFRWMSNPHGGFQKAIGVALLIIGVVVLFGLDKQFQSFVLDNGWYDPIKNLEESFTR